MKSTSNTSARSTSRSLKSRRSLAKPVGSFLPQITKKAFAKYGFSTTTLLTDWTAIVGAELAQWTRPERLNWPRRPNDATEIPQETFGQSGATLTLRVEPARALDVQYETQHLRDRINGFFGYQAISKIRILQAPIDPTTVLRPKTPHIQPENKDPALASEETVPPSPAIQAINDAGLRAALSRLETTMKKD